MAIGVSDRLRGWPYTETITCILSYVHTSVHTYAHPSVHNSMHTSIHTLQMAILQATASAEAFEIKRLNMAIAALAADVADKRVPNNVGLGRVC